MATDAVHETFWEGFRGAMETTPSDAWELLKNYMEVVLARHQFAAGAVHVDAALEALRETFGPADPNVQAMYEEHVLCCNSVAMQSLGGGSRRAFDRKALDVSDSHTVPDGPTAACFKDDAARKRLRGITLNNFACYFKKHGKLHTAIHYLEKTLKIEATISGVENPAGTHLNICAILSEMGRHVPAADHARCAIELLKHERRECTSNNDAKNGDSLLAIAYYNYGVELEHLRKFELAAAAYGKGHAVAAKELNPNHPMIHAIYQAMLDAQQRVASRKGYSTPR
ncbi:hypothetical protein ACHHYP_05872 [Achlya hypogyna]|uniref:MalT-like TPR region domain-containing protein n=1 Tax=Achlya hypogyna TaxID=1202772 RepID=A0A1V9YW33_ACHHY|nr:hypothetical protein ACHHYP_05872 [Achlya hypogyna]